MTPSHPAPDTLDLYRLGDLPTAEVRAVSNHLLWCGECRRTVVDARELGRLIAAITAHEAVAEYTISDVQRV